MKLKLTSLQLHLGLSLTAVLSLLAGSFAGANIIFGLLSLAGLLILPGTFILMTLRLNRLSFAERTLYGLGLSLVSLMLAGLAANVILPWANINRPLASGWLIPWLAVFLTSLAALSWYRNREQFFIFGTPKPGHYTMLAGFSLATLPFLSTLGATSLNNHGTAAFTAVMLALVGATATILISLRHRLHRGLWAWAIFTNALALLWATSLRGWYITGHDLQLEYYVYTLTDAAQRWDMSAFQDPYNACLSLTILPVLIKAITGLDAMLLYKIIYPVVFALGATGVFVLARRYTSDVIAFLAAWIFITFPTFMMDFPMLGRQELALTFFTLLLLVLFSKKLSPVARYFLLGMFGLGLILSHYSTTYVAIALFIGVYSLHVPWTLFTAWMSRKNLQEAAPQKTITLGVVLIVLIGTIIWSGLITHTGNNLVQQASSLGAKLSSFLSEQHGDDNASYSVVKHAQSSPQQLLSQYIADRQATGQTITSEINNLYTDAGRYHIQPVTEPKQPLTGIGRALQNLGLAPERLNDGTKQLYALALQGILVLGTAVAIWRYRSLKLPADFLLLAPAGLALVVVQTIVPIIDYGLLRLLQQTMIFLTLPALLGVLIIMKWLRLRSEQLGLQLLAVGFGLTFLVTSGVIPQLTGGSPGQLQLANSGFYHDAYYTTTDDLATARWLRENYPEGHPIHADMFTRMKLMANSGIVTHDGIVPAGLTEKSYVVLSGINVTEQRVALYWKGELLFYEYPTEFLEDHKNLIYSTSHNQVYR